jgi:hypothetical protein
MFLIPPFTGAAKLNRFAGCFAVEDGRGMQPLSNSQRQLVSHEGDAILAVPVCEWLFESFDYTCIRFPHRFAACFA